MTDGVFGEVIHSYTVHDAIRDGEKFSLDDIMAETDSPKIRDEVGIKWPVVFSKMALAVIRGSMNADSYGPQDPNAVENLENEGQSLDGRMWDTLYIMRHGPIAKMVRENDHFGSFEVLFQVREPRRGGEGFVSVRRSVKFFVSVDYWNEEHGCFSVYLPEEY